MKKGLLQKTIEDYLKSIFEIAEVESTVTTTALARKLHITPASVTEMVKKLDGFGYLHYTPYHGIQLTRQGAAYALKIIRRHRLWESFLYRILEYSWEDVHKEAEQLEHLMTDSLEGKIDRKLGFPEFDPHGHPIPSSSGKMPKAGSSKRLSQLRENDEAFVVQVSDSSEQFLKYVTRLGIRLEQKIKVKEKRDFDGSMLISIDGVEWNISREASEFIFVKK